MLNVQLLCTRMQISDRVSGEVGMKSCIALPGTGEHGGLMPWKMVCPNLGGFGEELYSSGSRVGLMIRIGVCAGPVFL